ncbi:CPBP family intramembrane metalloprotease [Vibrio hannami]|uniref:CPBP family intramembrane glutamic endopeptidase n=1 Tax=Vibrio hannami TaxID=2717094 RepID=UPI00241035B3|nr:CPBP family intramembrane glutamic endopeptidase [Vibrio hannami]MDG3087739.1 CPBP family intramembrane metalloprotease [Vibrio hannami]
MDILVNLTFIGLGIAALSVFQLSLLTPLLVILAIAGGYLSEVYELTGISVLIVLYLSALAITKVRQPRLVQLTHVVFGVICIALAAHKAPGINNYLLIPSAQTSSNAIPFDLYLNADKIHIYFALLLILPGMKNLTPVKSVSVVYVVCVLFALAGLQYASLPLGMMNLDFTIPEWLPLWAALNLLFTCTAEEAFFRGYVQQSLTKRIHPIYAIVITSLLFGIAHFAGGPMFMLFAALAGLGYGLVYHFSGRLHWAILTHFVFNLTHLIFFTYPLPV